MNAELPLDAGSNEMPSDADTLFIAFVRHRDVVCPRCDYSIRNAPHPICPECGEPLRLNVGLERPIVGALLATVVPCMGCGVCGMIFLLLISTRRGAPSAFVFATLVMLCSGVAGAAILIARRRFIRQSRASQRSWAIASVIVNALIVAGTFASIFSD